MKYTDIKNKIFNKRKGKIVFSDEIIIYETENEVEKIFQKTDWDTENIERKLNLYSGKLRKLFLDIFIDEFCFKKFEVQAVKDEVSEENLEKYIEYSAKEFLDEDNMENYFIKFFKKSDEIYIVFIFERDFIEEIVEFILRKNLKINKIFIKDEENYILDDYDILFQRKGDIKGKKQYIILGLIFILFFLGIKYYNSKLEREKEIVNREIILGEEKIEKLKAEYNMLEKEISVLKEKLEEFSKNKEYFNDKIFRILKMMPENITAENIYFEKNILTIKGNSLDENSLFEYSKILEKDSRIEKVVYDYIIKKENFYEFFLELKVQ